LKVNWLNHLEDNLSVLEERLLFLEKKVSKVNQQLNSKQKELEQTNKQLEYAQEQMLEQHRLVAIGSLVAGILHETNNPLQLVIGFAQLSSFSLENLKDELKRYLPKFSERKKQKIEKIISEIEDNLSLIDEQSLKISKNINTMLLQARISGSQKTTVNINQLIDNALPIVISSYKFKQANLTIKIETSYENSLENLELFAEDITKIIINLVKNACDSVLQKQRRIGEKFQPHITVKTQKLDDRFIAIIIRDNGEGIPDNLKEKIFQPYVTTKSAGEGTGLGLAIVKELIDNNQGYIKVRTEWGFYAEFAIILPC
jgi:two-component system NtrC family sensor kinase